MSEKIGELYYEITGDDSSLAKTLERIKAELKEAENSVVSLNEKAGSKKLTDAFSKTGETIQQVKNQLSALKSVWNQLEFGDTAGQSEVIAKYKELSAILNNYGKSMDSIVKEENKVVVTAKTLSDVLAMESNSINQLNAKLSELRRLRNEQNSTDANYIANMTTIMQAETQLIQKQRDAMQIGVERKTIEQQITEELSKRPKSIDAIIASQKRLKELYSQIEEPNTNANAEQLRQRYAELSTELQKYGTIVPKTIVEEMNMTKAMSMQSATIEQMIQKQKALVEARAKENVSTKQGRQNVADINAEYNRLNSRLQDFGVKQRRVNDQLLGQSRILSQLKGELGAYLSIYAVQRFISEMIRVRGEYQMQQTALSAIIGEATKAEEIFGRIQALGLLSPFSTLDLVGYVKQLAAFKVETNELFDTTKALADISSGLGVDMSRLVLAFGQVRAASVLRGTEVRQFTEAGIPLIAELAKKFAELNGKVVTTGEVFDLISTRQVPFEMVRDILFEMTEAGGMFYNMQEIQAETLKGKISNLRDAYEKMLNELGTGSQGVLNGAVDVTRLLVDNLDKIGKILLQLVVTWGIYKAVLVAATVVTTSFSTAAAAVAVSTKAAAASTVALNAAMNLNPAVLIATGVLSLAAAYFIFADRSSEAEKAQKRYNEAQEKANELIVEERKAFDELINVIKDTTRATEERRAALNQLKELYPEYFKDMKIESLSIDELIQKQREYNKTLEDKKALMEAERYQSLVKEKERLEKVTQEGLVNVLLSSKLERVKADILKIEEESEKKEKALLQSRYESGQAYENMAKYAKDINKFLKETNSSIKGIEPETGFSEYVEQLKDSYSEAKKVVEQFGGSIADTDNGIVESSRKTIKELEALAKFANIRLETKTSSDKKDGKLTAEDLLARKQIRLSQQIEKINLEALERKAKMQEEGVKKSIMLAEYERNKVIYEANLTRDKLIQSYNEANKLKGGNRITAGTFASVMPDEAESDRATRLAADEQFLNRRKEILRDASLEMKRIMADVTASDKTELQKQLTDIDVHYAEIEKKAIQNGATQVQLLEIELAKQREVNQAIGADALRRLDVEQENMLNQTELLLGSMGMQEYVEREKTKITIAETKKRINEYRALNTEEGNLQADSLENSLKLLKKSLGQRSLKSIFDEKITEGLNKAFIKTGKTAEEAADKTASVMSKAQQGGAIATEAVGFLQSAFGGLSEEADMALEAVGAIAQGFAQGGIAGGIMAAAQQVLSITAKLLTAKKEVDKSMIEGYKAYIEVIDELIDKQLESLESLGMANFAKTINKTLSDLEGRLKQTKAILNETLESGSGLFSHSLGYKSNKILKQYQSELKKVGIYGTDISKMNASQLISLKSIYSVWTKLPEEVRKYIGDLEDSYDKQDELLDQIKEMILGFDYSDITTAIVDSFTDPAIDNALNDLSGKIDEFISTTIKNILVKSMLIDPLTSAVNDFYNTIVKKDAQGNVTGFDVSEEAAKRFKERTMALSSLFGDSWDIIAERMKQAGIDITGGTAEDSSDVGRQGLSKGIATASQESIDALTGGVYASLDSLNTIRNNSIILNTSINGMSEELKLQTALAREIRDINVKIQNNTEFNKNLQYIRTSIDEINTKGLLIKER